MGMLVTPGIVVRTVNYRDNDRMLTLLTPEHGCLDVLSRGCRRPKSPLMPCSDLFVCGEYTLYRGGSRILLSECEMEDHFYPIRLDPDKLTIASYLTSICRVSVGEEQESARIYALLLKGLYYLGYDPSIEPKAMTGAFALLLSDALGYRPRMKQCVLCGKALDYTENGTFDLDITEGGFCCTSCRHQGSVRLRREDVVWMCQVLRSDLLRQQESISQELFQSLTRFLEYRLDTEIKAARLLSLL